MKNLDNIYHRWGSYLRFIKRNLDETPNNYIEFEDIPLDKYESLIENFNKENGYKIESTFYNKNAEGPFKIKLKISKLEKN